MPTASAQIFDGLGHPLRGDNLPLPDSLAPGEVLRPELTGEQIIRKCLTIRGVHNYSPCHLHEALAFLARTARYPYPSPVSDPFALASAETRQHIRVAIGSNA